MTYTPGPVANFPDDVKRELKKIAAEFVAMSAAIPKPAPVPVPVPSADVLWRWNADTVVPFSIQARDPSRVSVVTVAGAKWVRLLTMPGDSNLNNSDTWERCDLQHSSELTNGAEGREHWWKHSIMFPSDYVDPPESPENAQPWYGGVVFDFHNTTQGAWQANMQVQAMPKTATSPDRPTGLSIKMAWGTQTSPMEKVYPIGPIVRNVPYNLRYHVRWTAGATGYFDAWVNGKLLMEYRGPTLYPGQGTYIKAANYHSAFGKQSAVLHGPMVLAKTEAALA